MLTTPTLHPHHLPTYPPSSLALVHALRCLGCCLLAGLWLGPDFSHSISIGGGGHGWCFVLWWVLGQVFVYSVHSVDIAIPFLLTCSIHVCLCLHILPLPSHTITTPYTPFTTPHTHTHLHYTLPLPLLLPTTFPQVGSVGVLIHDMCIDIVVTGDVQTFLDGGWRRPNRTTVLCIAGGDMTPTPYLICVTAFMLDLRSPCLLFGNA